METVRSMLGHQQDIHDILSEAQSTQEERQRTAAQRRTAAAALAVQQAQDRRLDPNHLPGACAGRGLGA